MTQVEDVDSLDDVRSDKDLLSDSFDAVFSLNNSSLSLKPDPGSPLQPPKSPKPQAEKKTAAAAPKLEVTKPEEEAKTAASPKKIASAKKPPAKSAGTKKS